MQLAERLHMSVARCQVEVSSAEFVEWCAHFELTAEEAEFARQEAELMNQVR